MNILQNRCMGRPPTPTTEADRATGSVLWSARESLGLDLRQAESMTGITKSVISRIERGERPCRVTELITLAEAYGASPTRLFKAVVKAIAETERD
ncbi:helix-turn-helix domain-containing protein [Mycolicibacterium llatzerense]|uniref:helix-turn-helix domain-containing protein n=1 Tax=Mycolicibacterium llatzerense TaxID=280871 RepID=UPI001F1968DB|nr:helix-turn-helix transcriptional regulator [Mycolicibacterium llatzerense]